MEHQSDGDTNYTFGTFSEVLERELEELESEENHTNYNHGKNSERSSGDLKRLAVTQTKMKDPSANADVRNSHGVYNKPILEN